MTQHTPYLSTTHRHTAHTVKAGTLFFFSSLLPRAPQPARRSELRTLERIRGDTIQPPVPDLLCHHGQQRLHFGAVRLFEKQVKEHSENASNVKAGRQANSVRSGIGCQVSCLSYYSGTVKNAILQCKHTQVLSTFEST